MKNAITMYFGDTNATILDTLGLPIQVRQYDSWFCIFNCPFTSPFY